MPRAVATIGRALGPQEALEAFTLLLMGQIFSAAHRLFGEIHGIGEPLVRIRGGGRSRRFRLPSFLAHLTRVLQTQLQAEPAARCNDAGQLWPRLLAIGTLPHGRRPKTAA